MFNTVGIVGLGLMGGTFAKALRLLPKDFRPCRVIALDADEQTRTKASGEVDEIFAPESEKTMLSQCDLVIICLYPQASIAFLRKNRADFKPCSVVTDISGVKSALMRALPSILRDDIDFICGHPMAGSEKEGFFHADPTIFNGRNYILMPLPSNKPENIALFKELILALGFARITEATFHAHDHKVAFTSQLCHVIASALVDSAEDTEITAFGGGSYEDLTRIAMINAPMWTELFLANKSELIAHIDAFEVSLDKIKSYIQTEDSRSLKAALQSVREKRIAMTRREAPLREVKT